ncbi:ABC transporter ATP-binding protein [Spirillospora albida]|uniref:dipeptide ABC transporter ATP-binding protein n=1 Tax=Spirillospora albida TaxID=58123 RepID=UPI000A034CDE|nr:ABC transporter ATP-binding protein [Spirillospora albida]
MNPLEVTDLRVALPSGVRAVDGAGFEVRSGEVLGVVGESGSGKTTLGLAVMGLLPAGARVAGSVRLRGEELLGRTDAELSRIRGNDLAMVFQDPLSALTPVHPVGDQIAETIRIHQGVRRAAARARAVELLDLVGVPGAARRARAHPHELSGGMRQRVLIAMAIANRPAVIIADEPVTALDTIARSRILDVLRVAQASTGAAIVLITHDLDAVTGFADRVMVMSEGRMADAGPGRELPAVEVAPVPARPARASRPVVLEVSGLVRHHSLPRGTPARRRAGAVRAVDGVGFDVREAETVALVGESGCGKTTTLMEIMRLARPQGGRVMVMGQDTAALTRARRKALRRDVQVVFQDPYSSLDPRMRVSDIIAEPLTAHRFPRALIGDRVRDLLAMVDLDPAHARRHPHALSGGQRQRVGIARALALEPRLVLLDEPVAALDVTLRAGVLDLLSDLRSRLGLAYLLVTHDLTVVRRIADRVAVMHQGRIVETGPVDEVFHRPAHPYTRALLDPRFPPRDGPSDPAAPIPGCRFRIRCPHYAALGPRCAGLCDVVDPQPGEGHGGRGVACHHPLVTLEAAT